MLGKVRRKSVDYSTTECQPYALVTTRSVSTDEKAQHRSPRRDLRGFKDLPALNNGMVGLGNATADMHASRFNPSCATSCLV